MDGGEGSETLQQQDNKQQNPANNKKKETAGKVEINGISDLKVFLERKKLERASRAITRGNNILIGDANLTQPPTIRSAHRDTSQGDYQTKPAYQIDGCSAAKGLEK